MKRRYMRELKTVCGDNYMEVDVFPISERQKNASRAEKAKESRISQVKLNAKNALRYLVQLINTNFTEKDLHITATYSNDMLPQTAEQAERDRDNYLRRIAYSCKRKGLPKPQYICVCEYREASEHDKGVRFHHHIILKCGLSRDEIESQWQRGKLKCGTVNADRLQMDKCSLERLANYLLKYTNRRRRWKQSRGLKKPIRRRPNDGKYTQRGVERMARGGLCYDADYWAAKYPGWELNEATPVWNECTSEWSIYLKMRRRGA